MRDEGTHTPLHGTCRGKLLGLLHFCPLRRWFFKDVGAKMSERCGVRGSARCPKSGAKVVCFDRSQTMPQSSQPNEDFRTAVGVVE